MYDRVGPYKILRLINQGGQGSVYLGYDARLHRKVAIKIYHLPSDRAQRRDLLREARTVASIQSPKVVAIHDVIESADHLALVMEYVPGCNLEEFLQRVSPSLSSVLTVGRDVAGALALARQNQIVHGDLKPANILISDEGRVKLTDFGIARKMGGGNRVRLSAGSYLAVSPEQYRGEPLDHRSDLFAFGCLLYRMLSGLHPFYQDGRLDPQRLLDGSPLPLQDVVSGHVDLPEDLVELVNRLLRKEPDDRPRTTRGARLVIRRCARRLPLSAANNLCKEASPYFRVEDPDDLPLRIPQELGRSARSRLPPRSGHWARLRHFWRGLRWPAQGGIILTFGFLVGLPLNYFAGQTVTPVQFRVPDMFVPGFVDGPQGLPIEVSQDWLLDEIKIVLRQELGKVYVIGEIGKDPVTTVYSKAVEPERPTVPEAVFSLAVHCIEGLCVLDITRDELGKTYSGQGFLLAGMPVARWRQAVRDATRKMYH